MVYYMKVYCSQRHIQGSRTVPRAVRERRGRRAAAGRLHVRVAARRARARAARRLHRYHAGVCVRVRPCVCVCVRLRLRVCVLACVHEKYVNE